ncbi:MAG: hypothetical protein IH585_00575 [Anaerolineaceae bacterium]|nr:hypothetical protein [Anaerolineaceae bacterium]
MINEKDRIEVEQCIHDSIGWALNKDIERLFSILAHNDNFFIFHTGSRSTIVGFVVFKKLGKQS